ncbi:MAG: hypothetical protein H0W44_08960 [Gammaproteobacteria bacterium]|nr:hypothetical protein [Gammaproteobacteria bacterium]
MRLLASFHGGGFVRVLMASMVFTSALSSVFAVDEKTAFAQNISSPPINPWNAVPAIEWQRLKGDEAYVREQLQRINAMSPTMTSTHPDGTVVKVNANTKNQQLDKLYSYLDSIVPLAALQQTRYDGSAITLHYANKFTRHINLNNSDPSSTQTLSNQTDQHLVVASQTNNIITIETNTSSGAQIVETYTLNAANQQLKLDLEIRTPRFIKAQKLHFVYQRVISPAALSMQ